MGSRGWTRKKGPIVDPVPHGARSAGSHYFGPRRAPEAQPHHPRARRFRLPPGGAGLPIAKRRPLRPSRRGGVRGRAAAVPWCVQRLRLPLPAACHPQYTLSSHPPHGRRFPFPVGRAWSAPAPARHFFLAKRRCASELDGDRREERVDSTEVAAEDRIDARTEFLVSGLM
eukprot:scaffold4651_cov122-Isochrysis_galbana.AAC.1